MNVKELEIIISRAKKENWASLDLNMKGITELPESIGELVTLRKLYLAGNELSELPHSIGRLSQLEVLDLSENSIIQLPNSIGKLYNLRALRLTDNELIALPEEIIRLKKLDVLELYGNNFQNVPHHIYNQPPSELLRFLLGDQEQKDGYPIYEAKLMVVGGVGTGKSALIHKLLGIEYDPEAPPPDEGIRIHTAWKIERGRETIELNVWDFGPHENLYELYKVFMTKRTIYLVVVDPTKEKDATGRNDPEFWLHNIKQFSMDVPIIIAEHKSDKEADIPPEWKEYKQKYHIIDSIETSALEGQGIDELRLSVNKAIRHLHHLDEGLSASFHRVRDAVRRSDKEILNQRQFKQICQKFAPEFEPQDQEKIAKLLHDLGAVVHFDDDLILETLYVLDPTWISDAIIQIIRSEQLKNNHGILRAPQLPQILNNPKRYTRQHYIYLLSLMERFGFCHTLPETRYTYIVPEVFPHQMPETLIWEGKQFLQFEYHYDSIPEDILFRLMTRLYPYIEEHTCWRDGLLVEWEGTKAKIVCHPTEKNIEIVLQGADPQRMLHIIRQHFDDIHQKLDVQHVKEMIPGTCKFCSGSRKQEKPCLFEYHVLDQLDKKSKDKVMCYKSGEMLPIGIMLSGNKKSKSHDDGDSWIDHH